MAAAAEDKTAHSKAKFESVVATSKRGERGGEEEGPSLGEKSCSSTQWTENMYCNKVRACKDRI